MTDIYKSEKLHIKNHVYTSLLGSDYFILHQFLKPKSGFNYETFMIFFIKNTH